MSSVKTHLMTLTQLSKALRAKEFSSVELVRGFLDRIEAYQPVLNAMVTVLRDEALTAAQAADRTLAAGSGGPPRAGARRSGLPIDSITSSRSEHSSGPATTSLDPSRSIRPRIISSASAC